MSLNLTAFTAIFGISISAQRTAIISREIRRPVTANKARRSRPIQDASNSSRVKSNRIANAFLVSMDSHEGPSGQPRSRATGHTRQTLDSVESSADERYISDGMIDQFRGSLALHNATNSDTAPSSKSNTESDSNCDEKPKSLKRAHGLLQESLILPPEKLYKQPRVSSVSSPSSSNVNNGPASSFQVIIPAARLKDKTLNASTLSSTLHHVKEGKPEYSTYEGESEASESEKATPILPSSFASSELLNRVKSKMIERSGSRKHKSPSNLEQTPRVVINLISDDEEVSASKPRKILPLPKRYIPVDNSHTTANGQRKITPPPKKYVPRANSHMIANEQRNKSMHYGNMNGKHGPQVRS